MTQLDPGLLKRALQDAGIEVYRTAGDEIHIAERIRMHIMDSGVRVRVGETVEVSFTARAQGGDFPHAGDEELFDRLRTGVGAEARARGYEEGEPRTTEVRDPMDDARVLDTWYEVPYRKGGMTEPAQVVEEVRWVLGAERVLAP